MNTNLAISSALTLLYFNHQFLYQFDVVTEKTDISLGQLKTLSWFIISSSLIFASIGPLELFEQDS